ncbi:fungal tRNA ligase phosphodiesterase domain-containing protein [Jimgerdemannia flammicorona]|uniref:Fungal tRNA ligase phosphodiesterase domain-containing protein n=1 Tax=Jimgerdemannia flammicorona TaxID=994334 RepID=A0A433R0A0_9FUNG|nr:fungal tRNA ligase phosphodiesterase domain-containing protein [Jimgerdemannia flammicorona]
MHRFFCEFAPLDKLSNPGDAAIDNVIELDPLDDEATTLRKVISQLCPLIGVREPSDDEVQSALVYAKQYRPIARSKAPKPMYYGVKLDNDLQELLKLYLAQHAVRVDELTQQRFQKLVSDKRVPKDHHVTLLHSIDLKQAKGPELEKKQAMWNKFADAAGKDGGQGQHVTVRFCGLVSTDRLMTLEVAEIVPADVASVNKIAHVTVGTANDTVKPKESNTVLEQKEDIGPEHGILRTVLFGMGGEGMEMTGHVKAFY